MPSIAAPPAPSDTPAITARIRQVVGDASSAEVARRVRMPAATVRRQIAAPTVPFVVALCAAFGVSADWLCLGEGRPPKGVER